MWSIYTMDYYSPIRRDEIGSSVVMWMGLESVIKSKVSQKEKNKYHILIYIYIGEGDGNPFHYSHLENSMHRGASQATVHGVTKGLK